MSNTNEYILPYKAEEIKNILDKFQNSPFEDYTSTNLLNLEEVTIGKGMDASGREYNQSANLLTGYIAVNPDDVIAWQAVGSGKTDPAIREMRFITAYDANKNIVPSAGVNTNAKSYSVPDGIAFVRLTLVGYTVTQTDTVSVHKGADIIPYEPYYVYKKLKKELHDETLIKTEVDKAVENINIGLSQCNFAEKENILDVNTSVSGYLYNGNVSKGSTYNTSDYIEVAAAEDYAFYDDYHTSMKYVAEYDENKTYIQQQGEVKTLKTSDTTKYIRVTYYASASTVTVVKGSIPLPEARSEYLIPERYILSSAIEPPLVFLPDEIICAVGRTIEIYNSQVCPLANRYHFRWNCSVGKALSRKFSITGTETLIGEHSLTLEIYDDNFVKVFSKKITIKIVSNAISTSYTICPIGDSLTNNKYWLNEVRNLSENKISFVGTRGSTDGLKHEGRSGWRTTHYLKETAYNYENEGVHPFWDAANSKFSWAYYKEMTGVSPAAVQIFLGTNDLITGAVTPEQFAANIVTMLDAIREDDALIRIFLVLTICCGNQDGLGTQQSSDGYSSQKGAWKYKYDNNIISGLKVMYETVTAKNYTNVYFVPLTQCHDSEYNFGAVETPVNPRATQIELLPKEAIHPQKQGYEQMADVMYSVYCQVFGE